MLSPQGRLGLGTLTLDVSATTESVTVAAEAGRLQLQTQSGERSDLVTNQQIKELALNGRDFNDFAKTMVGVTSLANLPGKRV